MDFVKPIDLEESFSFSFRNVIDLYSVEAFSSDDEEEETFFEIDLDSTHGADGFEFKISFSSLHGSDFSVIQRPGYDLRPQDQTLVVESFEFPTRGTTSSGVPTVFPEEEDQYSKPSNPSTGRKTLRAKLSASPRGTVKISPVTASPKTGGELVGDGNRQQQLLGSRRSVPYKMTASFTGGGTMKFLIKFRSGKFFSTFMSLLKKLPSYNVLLPRHIFRGRSRSSKLINQETFRKHSRLSNPFQKWFALINATYQLDDNIDDDPIINGEGEKVPVTEAIGNISTSFGGLECGRKFCSNQKILGGTRSSSSQTACKGMFSVARDNVLIRPGKATGVDERESSVGAAIAHCKNSFAGYVDR